MRPFEARPLKANDRPLSFLISAAEGWKGRPTLALQANGSTRPPRGKLIRRFGAKPDKKIVDRSSGEAEFMEDAFHCNSDGLVVGVDRFCVVRPACWVASLSGGQERFDSFVSEYEQRSHRSEPSWERLVAAGGVRTPGGAGCAGGFFVTSGRGGGRAGQACGCFVGRTQ